VINILYFILISDFPWTRMSAVSVIALTVVVSPQLKYRVVLLLLLLAVSGYARCYLYPSAGHVTRYLLGGCVRGFCIACRMINMVNWHDQVICLFVTQVDNHWGIFSLWNRCSFWPGTVGTAISWGRWALLGILRTITVGEKTDW
jgi:hypothetical protein